MLSSFYVGISHTFVLVTMLRTAYAGSVSRVQSACQPAPGAYDFNRKFYHIKRLAMRDARPTHAS